MKKRKILLLIVIALLLLCLIIFFFFGRKSNLPLPVLPHDDTAEEWDGDQKLPNGNMSKLIEIPGFQSLVFFASDDIQKVNFYNPESNSCLMKMTLYADDMELWHNENYLVPGKGYYEIVIENMPGVGNYDGKLQIECFNEEGIELNGAVVNFDLTIKE